MKEIDLTKCEKILEDHIDFPEGTAYLAVYRIPGKKSVLSIIYNGNVPEEFRNEVNEIIRTGAKSKEIYFFPESDFQ